MGSQRKAFIGLFARSITGVGERSNESLGSWVNTPPPPSQPWEQKAPESTASLTPLPAPNSSPCSPPLWMWVSPVQGGAPAHKAAEQGLQQKHRMQRQKKEESVCTKPNRLQATNFLRVLMSIPNSRCCKRSLRLLLLTPTFSSP